MVSHKLQKLLTKFYSLNLLVLNNINSTVRFLGDVDPAASCTALTLKPDKPPKNDKDEVVSVRKQRNQHIASFSVRLLKVGLIYLFGILSFFGQPAKLNVCILVLFQHLVASGKDADE